MGPMGQIAQLTWEIILIKKAHLRKEMIELMKRKTHYLLFKNRMVLISKNFITFCQNWPNGSVKDLYISSMYFAISLLSLLGKGWDPVFEQTWIPVTQGCCLPSLVEMCPVVLEKKMKMLNVYRQTDRQKDGQTNRLTDDGQQAIWKALLSFQLK